MNVRGLVFGAALSACAVPACAEPADAEAPLRATFPDAADHATEAMGPVAPAQETFASRDCGSREAVFGTGAQKVWVTRIGSALWHNPLRPLAPEPLRVVQVAVNGRGGSAFGTDFDHLQQGDPAATLAGVEPVRWSAALGEVPAELRVVADDGRVLLGPLAFAGCGDAPKVARAPARNERRRAAPTESSAPVEATQETVTAPRPARREASPRPSGLPIPQGAIR